MLTLPVPQNLPIANVTNINFRTVNAGRPHNVTSGRGVSSGRRVSSGGRRVSSGPSGIAQAPRRPTAQRVQTINLDLTNKQIDEVRLILQDFNVGPREQREGHHWVTGVSLHMIEIEPR